MTESTEKTLRSMAASSAMEGLPLSDQQLQTIQKILNGETSLQDYFAEVIASGRRER